MLTLGAGGTVVVGGNSLAARARGPIRKRLHAQALLGAAVAALLTVAGWAGPASARAQADDLCLLGTWTYSGPVTNSLNPEAMRAHSIDVAFPSSGGGAATLSIEIETELGFREYVGSTAESYEVGTASTPDDPGGALDWTHPASIPTLSGVVVPEQYVSGGYSCDVTTLSLAVPIAIDGPLTFTRSSIPPAGVLVATTGTGSGEVTSDPPGIACATNEVPCSAWFPAGPAVLTPTADPGSGFLEWEGECSGSDCAPMLLAGKTTNVTARFEPVHTLAVAKAGKGDGEVSSVPSGISCPTGTGDCPPASFVQGTRVTLTAEPASGSIFQGWSGACSGQGDCELPMDSNTSVTATFEPEDLVHKLSVSKEGKGAGTVSSQPAGIECGSLCSAWFLRKVPVVLSAQPTGGGSFGGWSGGCSGTGSCVLTMDEDESVTASFTAGPAETVLARSVSEVVAKLAQLGQNSVLGFVFHALQSGVLTIGVYGTSPGAKLARVSSTRPTLVAVGRHAFARAGTAKIKIKLTPAGRALLKHHKRLTLTAKGTFKPHGKAAVMNIKTFVLRRH